MTLNLTQKFVNIPLKCTTNAMTTTIATTAQDVENQNKLLTSMSCVASKSIPFLDDPNRKTFVLHAD